MYQKSFRHFFVGIGASIFQPVGCREAEGSPLQRCSNDKHTFQQSDTATLSLSFPSFFSDQFDTFASQPSHDAFLFGPPPGTTPCPRFSLIFPLPLKVRWFPRRRQSAPPTLGKNAAASDLFITLAVCVHRLFALTLTCPPLFLRQDVDPSKKNSPPSQLKVKAVAEEC